MRDSGKRLRALQEIESRNWKDPARGVGREEASLFLAKETGLPFGQVRCGDAAGTRAAGPRRLDTIVYRPPLDGDGTLIPSPCLAGWQDARHLASVVSVEVIKLRVVAIY